MRAFILVAAAAVAATGAWAQPINGAPSQLTSPTTATSSPSVAPQVPAARPRDPVICKSQEQIGTRLGGKRICMTKSQWDQQAMDAQRQVMNAQNQPR